ncbi:MAG TPA: MMPL family transporter [Dehalococcoidia bacterium]|nr:MMPL family transporter [Dehalococcoidia bacterium]
MRSLANFCYDRRRYVLAGWILLLVGLFALSGAFAGEFKTEFKLPGSESQAAVDLLKEKGVSERTGFAGQVVVRSDQGVNNATTRQTLEKFLSEIKSSVEGLQVNSPYDAANAHQISSDGKIAFAELNFSDRDNEQYFDDAEVIKDLHKDLVASLPQGTQIELGGDLFADAPEFSSELFGVLAAIVILLLVFGSVLAMGLPIITALFGIGCGAALIGLVTNVLSVPEFTTQIAAMIGIGVGIDYALLIVTRYRAGLHDGLEPRDAVALSVDTSGRAVVFAGITVVISLLGMFFLNLDFMRSMATGAVLAVLMTMLAAITLLPAMLGFVGRHIDSLRVPFLHKPTEAGSAEGDRNSFWYRWSRIIQGHPWPALVVATAVLVVLAIPVFSIRLGFADAGNRLEGDTTRKSYDLLSQGFGVGFNAPALVVVETPNGASDASQVARLKTAIENTDGVASVAGPIPVANGQLQLFNVFSESAPQDEETTEMVHRLRKQTIAPIASSSAVPTLTTGGPAFVVDFSDYMSQKLPIFFGAVLVLSFLLLMTVFHSVVVPVKAVLMNMLSIGASFGAMVAVFQWGVGADLIGVGKEGPIEAWAPMMIFAIVFGLSMDYEVFLLTRVREEYDRTGDNGRAVADGLAATGRVISAAALIMICVFGSFMLGSERALKLMGFGLAFAVLIDATIVRLVLVPAAMELMGKANWWAPSWLVRYLPHIKVDTVERPLPQAGGGGGG